LKQLHAISTGNQEISEFLEKMKQIHMHLDYIHLRERGWTAQDYLRVIEKLHKMGVKLNKIIINDRVDVAIVTKVGGVQLPSHSIDVTKVKHHFSTIRIGCSVHSVEEAIQREEDGADYLLYGHIFSTKSKANVAPRGLKSLRNVVRNVKIPVIAIGGITPQNVKSVIDVGATGIAAMTGIFLAKDAKRTVIEYRKFLDAGNGGNLDEITS